MLSASGDRRRGADGEARRTVRSGVHVGRRKPAAAGLSGSWVEEEEEEEESKCLSIDRTDRSAG